MATSLTPGTRLGPYEVLGSLGAGGMGEVYRAKDTRLGRTVALKVLPPELAADPAGRRRLEQEARAVSALNHPHICVLYDIGSTPAGEAPGGAPTDYLVLEYLEGQTLAARLEKGPLPVPEVLEYGAQVADALAKAHRHGILHRDIKPGNVMLTKAGAKLLDFGLAKARLGGGPRETGETATLTQGPVTSAGLIVGTVPYMAPEVLEGKEADARTDIFALGATLYEMVAGRRAFAGESHASLIAAIMTGEAPPLSDVATVTPPALDRLIRRCLAKDPDDRWQSAGDIARQLEGLAEEWRLPGSGSQTRGIPAGAPAASRRLTAAWLGLAALVLAALGAGGYFVGQRTAARPVPSFHRLTFRQGIIDGARFMADGQSVIYTARWDGKFRETFTVRSDGADSEPRDALRGLDIQASSSRNEIAALRGNRLTTAPLVGGAPREVAGFVTSADWAPDGAQLAVTRWNNEARVVEYPIGKVLYRPSSREVAVADVRVSPRGDLLAFREHVSSHGRVIVIDTTGKKRAESSFIDGVSPPTWRPDGAEVWFSASTAAGQDAVRALDLSGRERTLLRSPGLVLYDVSRDGRVLLASVRSTFSIFGRGPGDTAERNLTYYGWSLLDDLSPDGRTILFTEGGESDPANGWSIFIRPTDGSPPQTVGRGHYAYGRLSPDGKWVAAETFNQEKAAVALIPTGAGEERVVTQAEEGSRPVVGWLPDSSAFLFQSNRQVWLAPISGAPRAITPEGWSTPPNGLIAPDGQHFLCFNNVPGGFWGYLCPIDAPVSASLPRLLDRRKWGPVGWSADGKRLWVTSMPAGVPLRLFALDLATGNARPWKELGGQLDPTGLTGVSRLHVSADGESYAYTFGRTLSTLYVADGVK